MKTKHIIITLLAGVALVATVMFLQTKPKATPQKQAKAGSASGKKAKVGSASGKQAKSKPTTRKTAKPGSTPVKLTASGFLTLKSAKMLLKQGAFLVDVRTPGEYKTGSIKNAKNIPLRDVTKRLAEFGAKDRRIIVYCRSGYRSGLALKKLQASGYKHVYNLGGIGRWK